MIRERERIVVVGSGPAAWTAAVYAGRAELDPLVLEGSFHRTMIPGGQLMFTTEVENFPGFKHGVDGQTLMLEMKAQAQRFGARVLSEDAVRVVADRHPFEIETSGGKTIRADAIIVATGANAKWLGLPNEQRLAQTGGGVSACAVCDGALPHFRDKVLAVVGGGDSAMEEALYLTKFAREVVVVHRRDQLRASRIMAERAQENPKIRFALNKVVTEVHGEDVITGIRLRDTITGEESDLEVGGLFIAIGHEPNTAFLRGVVELKENGYIKMPVAWRTQTSVPGIFAAGDVMDDYYRQAVTAAGTGCMAALDAERWLAHGGAEALAAASASGAEAGRTA
ncbi:MAG TPA: thioredoxin-disulfide reductase [Longimicrobiales bacterium]|nr:thioredoxin-disulfide reductase [Longimicrobiales bacterium]